MVVVSGVMENGVMEKSESTCKLPTRILIPEPSNNPMLPYSNTPSIFKALQIVRDELSE